jgi:hypothetical protein
MATLESAARIIHRRDTPSAPAAPAKTVSREPIIPCWCGAWKKPCWKIRVCADAQAHGQSRSGRPPQGIENLQQI